MKLKNILLTLSGILLLTSCASTLEEIKASLYGKDDSKADLVTKFDIPDGVGDFKETPIDEDKKDTEVKAATETTTNKTVVKKEVVKKEVSSQKTVPSADKAPIKPVIEKTTVTTTPKKNILGFKLPENYPEEYKGYDKKSAKFWESYEPRYFPGEESIITVNYLGVTAGYITMQTKERKKINGKDVYHFYGRLKSSDSYRYFYWLDDVIESYVDEENFLPVKYELIQREKKQNVDDLQLFEHKNMMTYHWYKRVKEGKTKEEKIEGMIPSLATDSFSALQFVRGLPLVAGDIYEFPVITRGKFWLIKVAVDKIEKITIQEKEISAIKVRAETQFPGVLKKNGDIHFWYSNNADRKLLKFQAKVKIGSINGELIEYKPGKRGN